MKDINTQPWVWNEIQPKPWMWPIDVASQHVKGSMEWLLELLEKWDELSPEMRQALKEQAQELLSVLRMEEEGENISLSEEELSEIKAYIESDVKNTWKWRDKTVKTESWKAETPLDFYKRVYAKWIPRLTKGELRHIDWKLYEAFNNWTKNGKNTIPEDILINKLKRHWKIILWEQDFVIYHRVIAWLRRNKKI